MAETPSARVSFFTPGNGKWILAGARSFFDRLSTLDGAVATIEGEDVILEAADTDDTAAARIAEVLRDLGFAFSAGRDWSPAVYIDHLKQTGLVCGEFLKIYWLAPGKWSLQPTLAKPNGVDHPLNETIIDVIWTDDPNAVDRLIGQGVDISDRFGGQTLLSWAALFGRTRLAEQLVDAGASLLNDDKENLTALGRASFGGTAEIVSLLLAAGADPNGASNDGLTPLMMAAKQGHVAIVRELIEHGADPTQTDALGLGALSWAVAWADHAEVVSILMDAGARPDQRDLHRLTPLDRAVRMGFGDATRVMREHRANPATS
jgi:ankyrin repeat protein